MQISRQWVETSQVKYMFENKGELSRVLLMTDAYMIAKTWTTISYRLDLVDSDGRGNPSEIIAEQRSGEPMRRSPSVHSSHHLS